MSVLDSLLDSPVVERFNPGEPRDPHGRWLHVTRLLDLAHGSAGVAGGAREAIAAARAAHQADPSATTETRRVVRLQLRRAARAVEKAPGGSGMRAANRIQSAREAFDSHAKLVPTPDMAGAIHNLIRRQYLVAADEGEVVGALLEAFTSGGPFNSSQHPRGQHGYFIASGSQGPGVKRVQGAVGAKQDGQFGPQTKAAIQKYQRKHSLQVDGVIGRQTAAALLGGEKGARHLQVGAMSDKQAKALGVSAKQLTGGSARATRSGSTATTRTRTTTRRAHRARHARAGKPHPQVRSGGGLLVG